MAPTACLWLSPMLAASSAAYAHNWAAPLPTTVAAMRSPAPVALVSREARLHSVARRAALAGRSSEAQQAYNLAIEHWGSGRSFLLSALLQSRLGLVEDCRRTFIKGNVHHPTDASLIQAWGLFESKQGELRRALWLLRRAVTLNPELSGVLRWKIFEEAAAAVASARTSRAAAPSMLLASDEDGEASEGASVLVPRPPVKYTIQQAKRGWRGRGPDFDEDPKSWYDDEGKRNGPPMNYWRQASDERTHRNVMDAVDAIVAGEGANDENLRVLESRMGIKNPMRNRKLLGRWAVLVSNGAVVASRAGESTAQGKGELAVRSVLRVARAGEKRTMEHRYGTFDEHMYEGEELAFTISSAQEAGQSTTSIAGATTVNDRVELPLQMPDGSGVVHVGGVSLLNDYVLVARDAEGAICEAYLRLSPPPGAPEPSDPASGSA